MTSFVVWKIAANGRDTWKTIDAEDARQAAEMVCGLGLRNFGTESEVCARVRAIDTNEPAVLFYSEKAPAKAKKTEPIPEPV
ncbi:hypothetical protein IZ6_23930 [Terrihabitans soli]|uniref:Uncharacterized protein n=1 Tax=Terrihabitans soli TaxID=708113 RepID=A0A6S6QYK4_9HYPH|nr:hypothetical protein [Terrihabitans soli]BCJ91658.1 hypothetical protein IZ6_23930 [Terrihabitans soli]